MRALLIVGLTLGALALVAPAGGSVGGSVGAAATDCVPRGSKKSGHRTTRARARRVVERYAAATFERCDGVEGMGVGAKTPDDRPARSSDKVHHIAIYLRDPASKPPRSRSIAGVTIVYVVTGPITPQ